MGTVEAVTEVAFTKHRYHEHRDMMDWCRTEFGPGAYGASMGLDVERYGVARSGNERWGFDSAFGNFTFYFKYAQDAFIFKLRWK